MHTCTLINPAVLSCTAHSGSAISRQHIWPHSGRSKLSSVPPVEAVPLAPTIPLFRANVLLKNINTSLLTIVVLVPAGVSNVLDSEVCMTCKGKSMRWGHIKSTRSVWWRDRSFGCWNLINDPAILLWCTIINLAMILFGEKTYPMSELLEHLDRSRGLGWEIISWHRTVQFYFQGKFWANKVRTREKRVHSGLGGFKGLLYSQYHCILENYIHGRPIYFNQRRCVHHLITNSKETKDSSGVGV